MKPLKTYYKGDLVKTIFNLIDETKVDIIVKNEMIKNVEKSELMVSLVDAQKEFKKLEDKIDKIREIL